MYMHIRGDYVYFHPFQFHSLNRSRFVSPFVELAAVCVCMDVCDSELVHVQDIHILLKTEKRMREMNKMCGMCNKIQQCRCQNNSNNQDKIETNNDAVHPVCHLTSKKT